MLLQLSLDNVWSGIARRYFIFLLS